jgi:hypothetical protein
LSVARGETPAALPRVLAWWCVAALTALAPALVTLLLLHTLFGATVTDTVPTINDEVVFWLEVDTFRVAGFNGGYHTTNEQMAPARWSRFDPKGPGFPVLYGTLARVFGWQPWSGAVFGLCWITVGAALWLGVERPGGARLAAAALVVATFWPGLMYLPSTMQEGLHVALAFFLAAAMHPAFVGARVTPARFAAATALIAACALVRLTWVFLLVPWCWLSLPDFSRRGRVVCVAASCGMFAALIVASRFLNAPHILPEGVGIVGYLVREWKTSPAAAASFFFGHAWWNLCNLVWPGRAWPLEVLLHYEMLGLLAAAAVMARRLRGTPAARPWTFALLNLGVLLAASVVAYDIAEWRDYRLFAPHLLLSLLALIGSASWRWALAPAFANLLFVSAFLTQYTANHRKRVTWDRDLVAELRKELGSRLHYDPSRSPWDNTILVPVDFMDYPMIAVPSGMGVNPVLDWSALEYPPRSRYLLLPPEFGWIESKVRLRPLARTPMGWLCLNLDSGRREP